MNSKLESTSPGAAEAALPPANCSACLGGLVDLAKRIPFRMMMHVTFERSYHADYLNQELNVACCVTTKRSKVGRLGKSRMEYGINERKAKSYPTLAALLVDHPEVAKKASELYQPNAKLSGPDQGGAT